MENLSELVRRLTKADVEFVLVGGFAVASYGVDLVTRDVDICCRFTAANLMRIQSAVHDLHPVHRSRPDIPLALTPTKCEGFKNLYLKTDLGALDCLSSVLGVGDFDTVANRSIEVTISAGTIRLIDIDALIDAKKAMNRPHDLVSISHLKLIKERLL